MKKFKQIDRLYHCCKSKSTVNFQPFTRTPKKPAEQIRQLLSVVPIQIYLLAEKSIADPIPERKRPVPDEADLLLGNLAAD